MSDTLKSNMVDESGKGDWVLYEADKILKEFIRQLKKKEIIQRYGSTDIVKTGVIKIEDIDKLSGFKDE